MFLHDIYHGQKILRGRGGAARRWCWATPGYCDAMVGFDVPFGTYVHVCGTDIVRDETGRFLVLEDNARTPSGVAYVVENRHMSQRVLSDVMTGLRVRGVDEYGLHLHHAMCEIAPPGVTDPQVVVLSPGIFNSAYFEHVFLAREMGVPLVEGRDLVVENGTRVDAHHRRAGAGALDLSPAGDDFLDPDAFNPEACSGVRGLIEAWRRGNVAIANAVGTGVADDKAMLRLHAAHHPLLPRRGRRSCRMSIPTFARSRTRWPTRWTIWTSWW